jgi:hypothetical protein
MRSFLPILIKSTLLVTTFTDNNISRMYLILFLMISPFMTGCHSFGPDGLRGTYPLYNAAIVDSQNEQFLQNIVRLHYRDPVFFLDVTSVTASLKMDLAASTNGTTVGFNGTTGQDILTLNAGGAYSSAPTISYSPLQGEGFVKSILRPISIEDVFALTESGWSARRVLGLCVEHINGLDNASTASGPTPKISPKHIDSFNRLLDLFDKVSGEDLINPRIDPITKETQLEIKSSPAVRDEIWEIKELLGLDQKLDIYHVNDDFMSQRHDTISIRSRSLMSIFFYLSHHVDTPSQHKADGLITVTLNKDGSAFDWGKTAGGGLFHILNSEKQPDLPFVAIPYRGQWFYLADNDLESKSTFMLLTQLFRLQAGAAKSVGPTLTLPVR